MSRRRAFVVAASLSVALPLHAALAISIAGPSVTARGLTPGGGAVFFSAAHEPHVAYSSIRRTAKYVVDDDRDGIVSLTMATDVPAKSIWLVVDARTGHHVVATREGYRDRVTPERRSRGGKHIDGHWSSLIHERPWLELLVVRPGGDVWELTAMLGGAADTEKSRGPEFTTPVSLFRPLTPGARPLERLNSSDVVIAIDPHEVEYFLVGLE